MARKSYLFTSESVSEGHPDKVCDRISDEMVDLFYPRGPQGGHRSLGIRAACETLATTNRVDDRRRDARPEDDHRIGSIHVARMAIKDIGYEQEGFHWDNGRYRGPAASAVG